MPAEQYGREAKHLQLVQLQQAHYPSDPMQPGPIYFLTPRKCAMFGVCCESIPRQVFFLIDEAMNIGKGANAIMSMLHYYFKHHGSGKALWISMLTIAQAKIKTIHWFNICSGGSWQSSTSISHSHFSFLVRERVSCLEDIVKTVKSSTVNVAQLVGTQDGQVIVPMYVTGLHTFLSTFESSYESRSTTTFSSQSVLVASLRAPMQKHLRRRLIWYLVTVGLQVVISCLTRTMSTSMVSVWKHKGIAHMKPEILFVQNLIQTTKHSIYNPKQSKECAFRATIYSPSNQKSLTLWFLQESWTHCSFMPSQRFLTHFISCYISTRLSKMAQL